MSLPRSCHVCDGIHQPGEPCPVARVNWETKRGTATQRYGQGWAAISRRVLERDRHVCLLQLPGCTGRATTADHIVPRSQGGTHHMDNLQAACRACNSRKGARAVA
jgi:5-methylcytosine-specific restriction endonuclease McrA